MDRSKALAILKQHREELMQSGVESLSIIGSVARGQSGAESDVDVAVEFGDLDEGFAHFRRLDELQERLSEILGCRVDLIEAAAVSPRVRREIDRDRVLAF